MPSLNFMHRKGNDSAPDQAQDAPSVSKNSVQTEDKSWRPASDYVDPNNDSKMIKGFEDDVSNKLGKKVDDEEKFEGIHPTVAAKDDKTNSDASSLTDTPSTTQSPKFDTSESDNKMTPEELEKKNKENMAKASTLAAAQKAQPLEPEEPSAATDTTTAPKTEETKATAASESKPEVKAEAIKEPTTTETPSQPETSTPPEVETPQTVPEESKEVTASISDEVKPVEEPKTDDNSNGSNNGGDNKDKSKDSTKPKKSNSKIVKVLLAILGVFFVLLLIVVIFMALVAHNVVPISNQGMKLAINTAYSKIPLVPKTPENIIQSALLSHATARSGNVNGEIKTNSNVVRNISGFDDFSINVTGPMSFKEQGPEFDLQLKIQEELDANIRLKNDNLYAKLNEFPSSVISNFFFIDVPRDAYVDQWVLMVEQFSEEPSSGESESGPIRPDIEVESSSTDPYGSLGPVYKVLSEEVFPMMTVLSDERDGKKMTHLHLELNADRIDQIHSKYVMENEGVDSYESNYSDFMSHLILDIWIDKETNYFSRVEALATINSGTYIPNAVGPGGSLGDPNLDIDVGGVVENSNENNMDVLIALDLNDVGKEFNIVEPTDFMTLDEFMAHIATSIIYNYSFEDFEVSEAIDDLASDAVSFYSETKSYPDKEELIISTSSALISEDALERAKISYNIVDTNDGLIIYTTNPNKTLPGTPYYTVVVVGDSFTSSHISQADLLSLLTENNLVLEFPFAAESVLEVPPVEQVDLLLENSEQDQEQGGLDENSAGPAFVEESIFGKMLQTVGETETVDTTVF